MSLISTFNLPTPFSSHNELIYVNDDDDYDDDIIATAVFVIFYPYYN